MKNSPWRFDDGPSRRPRRHSSRRDEKIALGFLAASIWPDLHVVSRAEPGGALPHARALSLRAFFMYRKRRNLHRPRLPVGDFSRPMVEPRAYLVASRASAGLFHIEAPSRPFAGRSADAGR